MIERLEIENFQSHKKSVLEFAPGVNVIVGPSDTGKSSIIRAFKWITTNRPLGDAFRSHWGGDTIVRLAINGEIHVERCKGVEEYYKTDLNGVELEFKAFGTQTPDEVVKALNLDEINIQHQHDNAFLISNNPGEVARHFNKIANIDQIHTSQKAVEKWIRAINQKIANEEANIEEYEKQIKSFDYLDKMEADIEGLEQLETTQKNLRKKSQDISNTLKKLEDVEEAVEAFSELLKAEEDVVVLINLIEERKALEDTQYELIKVHDKLVDCEREIEENQHLLQDEELIDNLLTLFSEQRSQKKKYIELKILAKKVWDMGNMLKHKEDQLTELEKSWHENAPEMCPLCDGTGKLITEEK